MTIRDVPPSEWARFLDEFSRDRRGYLATVEHTGPGLRGPELRQRPLVGVTLHGNGDRAVIVSLHPREGAESTVRVEHPTRLRVHETEQGLAQHVEIDGEHGEHLMVRLRGVTPPDIMLDGVAPGEM